MRLAALAALATAVFLFQPAFLVALLAQGDAIAARASLGRRDRRRGRTGLGRVLLDGDRDQALGIGGSMQATSLGSAASWVLAACRFAAFFYKGYRSTRRST
ncbi:hypothetical protein ACPA9J_31755 [Pseudomonas aeruginosa]